MHYRRVGISALALAMCAATASAQVGAIRKDNGGNRLYNPFRVQFKQSWSLQLQDPVKLIDVGPVTDVKRSNLVLLIGGSTTADTQRRLRVMHWTGSNFDLDVESVSQSIGVDTLLLGQFHPGAAATPDIPDPKPVPGAAKPKKRKPAPKTGVQVLTNTGIVAWNGTSLSPLFPRQLPDVKQAILLDSRQDMVIVGAGDGALPFEFSQSEMRPAPKEKLQGAGYAEYGIGTQPFAGSEGVNLATGIRYSQAVWNGHSRWLIGLVRGVPTATTDDPNATIGDRLVVFTPKFPSRDKSFWDCRMDDMEEAWRSEPLPGRVLDVRVGDPHNDGKPGILVLTSESDGKLRRITFFAASGAG